MLHTKYQRFSPCGFLQDEDILSGLIWVQTVCKCDQQTRLVGKDLFPAMAIRYGFMRDENHYGAWWWQKHADMYLLFSRESLEFWNIYVHAVR